MSSGEWSADRERQCDVKLGSVSGLALHADRAAHQLDKSRRNSKPEAGSTEPPGGRSVCLGKCIKDSRVFVSCYADPGIADCDRHCYVLIIDALTLDAHHHLSSLREFHGVADQIDQDLSQARCVARQSRRQA